MKIKYSWLPFLLSLLLLTPISIRIGIGAEKKIESVGIAGISALALAFSIIFGFTLVLALMCHFSSDAKENCIIKQNSILSILSMITGIIMITYILIEFSPNILNFNILTYLFFILGLGSGVVFLLYGIMSFMGKDIFENFSYLVFLPILWAFLYFLYSSNTFDKKLNQLVSFGSILYVALIAFSFLFQGKIFSRFFIDKKTRSKEIIYVFGLMGILCCLFFTTIDILKHIFSGNGVFGNYLKNALDISICFYIASFILSIKSQKYSKETV